MIEVDNLSKKVTFGCQRRHFTKDAFWIEIHCDGWYIGSVWSAYAKISRQFHDDGATPRIRWRLQVHGTDAFLHAEHIRWAGRKHKRANPAPAAVGAA